MKQGYLDTFPHMLQKLNSEHHVLYHFRIIDNTYGNGKKRMIETDKSEKRLLTFRNG